MDPAALSREFLEKCAALVGANLELTLGCADTTVEESTDVPEEACAVVPIPVERNGEALAAAELVAPLGGLASIARRTLGAENPDKEAELSEEDVAAIAETLALLGGAAQEVLVAHLGDGVTVTPGAWWRTDDAGEHVLQEGEGLVRTESALETPDGPSVPLFLRIPHALLDAAGVEPDRIVFVGIAEDQRPALEPPGAQCVSFDDYDDEAENEVAGAAAVFIAEGTGDVLQLARRIRSGNGTWSTPTILCAAEPTEESVRAALHAGFSHVLKLPAEPADAARALALAASRRTRGKRSS